MNTLVSPVSRSISTELAWKKVLRLSEFCKRKNQALFMTLSGGCSKHQIESVPGVEIISTFSLVPWYLFFLKFIPNYGAVIKVSKHDVIGALDELAG